MMKKKKKYLFFLLILLIILFFVFLKIKEIKTEKKYFNKIEFNNKNIVIENYLNNKKYDTISYVLANQIFNFDTLNLFIYKLPEFHLDNFEFYAIVKKISFKKHTYQIYLNNKKSLSLIMITLSHEFVHIQQYEEGKLFLENNFAVFNGDTIYFNKIKYEDRPYEIEAFSKQDKIAKQLKKILYN